MERLLKDVSAPVQVVTQALLPGLQAPADAFQYGCPATSDEVLGTDAVTFDALKEKAGTARGGGVAGKWCLVWRGYCEVTAKVKSCQLAGAIGIIIVDHGNFIESQGDQEALVRISRAAGEKPETIIPLLFVSKEEGGRIISAAQTGEVTVSVGPSYGADPPKGYNPATGLFVFDLMAGPSGPSKAYPDLFQHVGWLEVSELRDILFVCLPDKELISLYDVSKPLE